MPCKALKMMENQVHFGGFGMVRWRRPSNHRRSAVAGIGRRFDLRPLRGTNAAA
jgi:hypothetical protein